MLYKFQGNRRQGRSVDELSVQPQSTVIAALLNALVRLVKCVLMVATRVALFAPNHLPRGGAIGIGDRGGPGGIRLQGSERRRRFDGGAARLAPGYPQRDRA